MMLPCDTPLDLVIVKNIDTNFILAIILCQSHFRAVTPCLEPAALFPHPWSVPILAELHRTGGSRFVILAHRLGVGPDSLRHTLRALTDHGWVMRNPGYGHPLRPEYILTPAGSALAPACAHLIKLLHSMEIEEAGLRKWSMPVLMSIQAGNRRFSDLKSSLAGITARALTMTLKDLRTTGVG